MTRKKIRIFLSLVILFALVFLNSCSSAAYDPFSYAPETPSTNWQPVKKNTLISSKYCEMLLPKDFANDDLSLGELIDIALHNNPNTKRTWAEARSKAALYGQSLHKYYPDLNGFVSYNRQYSTTIIGDINVPFLLTTVTPQLNISYTIFDFGQRRYSSEAARETLYYADWSHNQEIQIIIQKVMDDYYKYLFELQALDARKADLEDAKTTLDAAEAKFQFGVAALGDVSQAKTKYLQAKINMIGQKRAVESSFAMLATDVGLPANLSFDVQPLPERVYVDAVLESVDELIQDAQGMRQDFLAAMANVRSKEAELKYAKSRYYPSVTGSGDFGKNWYNYGTEEKYHWSFTFQVDFPLFRGFYYRNGVRNAKANLEKSTADLLEKELDIIKEVTTSHFDVGTAAETLECSEDYLKQAMEQFDIAIANYKAGTNTILDVLSAQASVADARSKLANAKRNWYTSLASLAYATGALCSPPAEKCNRVKL